LCGKGFTCRISDSLTATQGVSFLIMKPKRGTVREDGKIYWGTNHRKEYWVSQERFESLKTHEQNILKKKREELKKKHRKHKYGDTVGNMVFIKYKAACKNGEWWVIKDSFKEMELKASAKKKLRSNPSRKKCGDVREDGMIFWGYDPGKASGERWVTKEKFESIKERKNLKQSTLRKTEKARKYAREYFKKRKQNDPAFRLLASLRTLIGTAFKYNRHKKKSKTVEILGCSIEEFKAYIESQFLEGMSWENRSEWHLDHIMPVSMAKTEDELIRLNHYKNFRPLWAKDNIRKSNKTPDTLVLF